ncbi:glycosyltransferase family 4 protein [uncultured Sphingomonas sp.]|uniref:glycosyltransferase family 4 protein n=1 Tax=uncultured Sphingomonas sp. TaxID=158754 RepID=UPI0035CBC309
MQASDLRVALFSGNYNYTRDGPTQALNLLVGHLLAQGAAVRVYAPTTDTPAFAPTGDLVSVPSIAIPGERGEYRLARGLPRATRRDLAHFAPKVLHLSAPDFLGFSAVRWARRRNIPCVASLHTRFETYLRYYHVGVLAPVFVGIQRRFYNRVDRVMPPGESMAAVVRGWGVTTPTSIWSRGIDHDRFRPDRRDLGWRRDLGIGDDEIAIGFLGRLVKEKGLEVFAEVLAELTRRGVPHRVLVVGEGPARAWFEAQAAGAVFAGFQSGDDLGRAVASMDLFFNPSVTETFGNVTLEAMAAGVPVVAARATGAVDLVVPGETGFLVPPRDVAAYADALQRIITDPALRAQMGEAGHRKAAGYRWELVNQKVVDTYLEVMGTG